MWLIARILVLCMLAASLLVPVAAAFGFLRQTAPRRRQAGNWLGLTLSGELGVALPLYALAIAARAPATWRPYYLAVPVAAVAATLGYAGARVHLRRRTDADAPAPRLAGAYVGFAAVLVVLMVPWILGAPLPFGGGWFGKQALLAAGVGDYARWVVPLVLALLVEAFLLDGRAVGRSRFRVLAGAFGTLALMLAVVVLLPSSRVNSRHVAKLEFAAARAEAEAMDVPRRKAIIAIASGHPPQVLPAPCPEEFMAPEWQGWAKLAGPLHDWQSVEKLGAAWAAQHSVNVWHAGMGGLARLHDRNPHAKLKSPDEVFVGPWRSFVFEKFADDRKWVEPWPERDVLVGPEEARRRVHQAPSDVDATLVLMQETLSFAIANEITLGSVVGFAWVWSYPKQAIVCAGEVRVPHGGMVGEFHDKQASIVRDALRMRAAARAMGALHAVEPQPEQAVTSAVPTAVQQ
jgi:hypothetical protein